MRKALVVLLLSAAAGCSGGGSEERSESRQDLKTYDVSEAPAATDSAVPPPPPPPAPTSAERRFSQPPGIAPTAAPGVAFNYRYDFRLPSARVAALQEQHAAACEKLGIARCRITAMRYRLVDDDEIEAMLAFKLDPAIARGFGKQGIDAVTASEGMLIDAEITGEDVGSRIAAATRSETDLTDELKRIEGELARRGLGASERAQLQLQAQQLRDQIRATRTTKTEQQETLATTPMVFNYESGDLLAGFDGRPRLSQAMEDALENLVGGLLWILVALITLLPWALLVAAALWIWRRILPPLRRVGEPAVPPAPPAED
ncbi:MAG TPA: hypothetical protein VGB59_01205 [Allosphingosinicella sp.]|jgi:hypothetical protein